MVKFADGILPGEGTSASEDDLDTNSLKELSGKNKLSPKNKKKKLMSQKKHKNRLLGSHFDSVNAEMINRGLSNKENSCNFKMEKQVIGLQIHSYHSHTLISKFSSPFSPCYLTI